MGGHVVVVRCLAVIALAAGAASGCSGAQGASGPDAGPPASPSSSASSVRPSTTAETSARLLLPRDARAKTRSGAEAYVLYYFDRLNEAFVDPQNTAIGGLSEAACTSCVSLEQSVRDLHDHRQHISERPYQLSNVMELPESTEKQRAFQFVMKEAATAIVSAEGSTVGQQPSATHLMEVLLTQVRDGWVVTDLAVAKKADL